MRACVCISSNMAQITRVQRLMRIACTKILNHHRPSHGNARSTHSGNLMLALERSFLEYFLRIIIVFNVIMVIVVVDVGLKSNNHTKCILVMASCNVFFS